VYKDGNANYQEANGTGSSAGQKLTRRRKSTSAHYPTKNYWQGGEKL